MISLDDISVVIRCGDDDRVFSCIDSIDDNAEIIVSMSENPELQQKLTEHGIKYCLTPRGNLSIVSNIGFDEATHNKVVITDSDTIFEKCSIEAMSRALDVNLVVRAKLRFKSDKNKLFSHAVAEARDYVNSLPVAYTPGLGVRKEIIDRIGGYLFNNPVPFAVDADLNYRLHKSGIEIKYLDNSILYHDVESIRHDLKAAFRIGRGCMTSAICLSQGYHQSQIHPRTIVKDLKGVKSKHLGDLIKVKGPSVFFYQLIWDLYFYSGKNWQWMNRRGIANDDSYS